MGSGKKSHLLAVLTELVRLFDGVTDVCTHQNDPTVHVKYMQFDVCQLCLKKAIRDT